MLSIYPASPDDRAAPSSATAHAVRTARASSSVAREGTVLGLVVAAVTWMWLLLVDAAVGDPMRTFSVLGGTPAFTVTHLALCLAYGYVLVFAVHSAAREPSAVFALVFGSLLLEVGFAMLAVILSNLGLGALAWLRIFVGSLVGLGCAIAFLSRRHRLVDLYHRAEAER
jgi:hypothetical protein